MFANASPQLVVVVVAGEEMVPFLSGAHSHTFEIAPTDVET